MKRFLSILILSFIFLVGCTPSQNICKPCEYLNDQGICQKATCCSDTNCQESEKCFFPGSEKAFCGEKNACADATKVNTCSQTKPLFCTGRQELIEKCAVCGCNEDFTCQTNSSCKKIQYPVLLVHGFQSDSRAWAEFVKWFKAENQTVYTVDLVPNDGSIELLASELDQKITEIINITNASKINIVAHSMGGIVTRYYLANANITPVRKVAFLAVPHKGSTLSWFLDVNSPAANELRGGSEFMLELNKMPLKQGIDYLNLIGNKYTSQGIEYDGLILTSEAVLPNVTTQKYPLSHFEFQRNDKVFEKIIYFFKSNLK